MKLFVITISDVSDYVNANQKPEVYLTKKAAMAALRKLRKDVRDKMRDSLGDEFEEDDFDKNSTAFSMYRDGYHAQDHYDACIDEIDIDPETPEETEKRRILEKARKERLLKDIREFVGVGGNVPFEHGFRPDFNASEVTDTEVVLRKPVGREHRRRIPLVELDADALLTIVLDLFRYQNYCHLYA